VVTFRLDQATWDFMRQLVPYTKYRNASSFIREGIELLLRQEEEHLQLQSSEGKEAGIAEGPE
jgi:Arc/MetJ-type ribon-helix-helix transcriptional regulator